MFKNLFKHKKDQNYDYLFRVTKDAMTSKMDFKTLKQLTKDDLLSMIAFFESQLLIIQRYKESKQSQRD